MGNIAIDNGKIKVYTNNGIIEPDGTQKAVLDDNEEYTISAKDLAQLLVIVNGYTFADCVHFGGVRYGIMTTEKIYEEIEYIKKEAIRSTQIRERSKIINKIKCKINEYNKDRKIFWRPIEIDFDNED